MKRKREWVRGLSRGAGRGTNLLKGHTGGRHEEKKQFNTGPDDHIIRRTRASISPNRQGQGEFIHDAEEAEHDESSWEKKGKHWGSQQHFCSEDS